MVLRFVWCKIGRLRSWKRGRWGNRNQVIPLFFEGFVERNLFAVHLAKLAGSVALPNLAQRSVIVPLCVQITVLFQPSFAASFCFFRKIGFCPVLFDFFPNPRPRRRDAFPIGNRRARVGLVFGLPPDAIIGAPDCNGAGCHSVSATSHISRSKRGSIVPCKVKRQTESAAKRSGFRGTQKSLQNRKTGNGCALGPGPREMKAKGGDQFAVRLSGGLSGGHKESQTDGKTHLPKWPIGDGTNHGERSLQTQIIDTIEMGKPELLLQLKGEGEVVIGNGIAEKGKQNPFELKECGAILKLNPFLPPIPGRKDSPYPDFEPVEQGHGGPVTQRGTKPSFVGGGQQKDIRNVNIR